MLLGSFLLSKVLKVFFNPTRKLTLFLTKLLPAVLYQIKSVLSAKMGQLVNFLGE